MHISTCEPIFSIFLSHNGGGFINRKRLHGFTHTGVRLYVDCQASSHRGRAPVGTTYVVGRGRGCSDGCGLFAIKSSSPSCYENKNMFNSFARAARRGGGGPPLTPPTTRHTAAQSRVVCVWAYPISVIDLRQTQSRDPAASADPPLCVRVWGKAVTGNCSTGARGARRVGAGKSAQRERAASIPYFTSRSACMCVRVHEAR